MLEFAINKRIAQDPKAIMQRGDVVVVKLAGSPWSDLEKKIYLIAVSDDAEIEAKLVEALKAGDLNPVATLPYAILAPDPKFPNKQIVTQRSAWRIDVDKVETVVPAVGDPTIAVEPVLVDDTAWIDATPVVKVGIVTRVVRSILNFFGF